MNLQLLRKISRNTEAEHDKPVCLIIAASYGYDSDGRYTVNKAYSVEGKFLRIVGDKERE